MSRHRGFEKRALDDYDDSRYDDYYDSGAEAVIDDEAAKYMVGSRRNQPSSLASYFTESDGADAAAAAAAAAPEPSVVAADSTWACAVCTFSHEGDEAKRTACVMCETPRPRPQPRTAPAWTAPAAATPAVRSAAAAAPRAAAVAAAAPAPVAAPASTWACAVCLWTENSGDVAACTLCFSPRPPAGPPAAASASAAAAPVAARATSAEARSSGPRSSSFNLVASNPPPMQSAEDDFMALLGLGPTTTTKAVATAPSRQEHRAASTAAAAADDAPPPGYDAPPPGFDAPPPYAPPGFDAPPPPYAPPGPDYNAPPPGLVAAAPRRADAGAPSDFATALCEPNAPLKHIAAPARRGELGDVAQVLLQRARTAAGPVAEDAFAFDSPSPDEVVSNRRRGIRPAAAAAAKTKTKTAKTPSTKTREGSAKVVEEKDEEEEEEEVFTAAAPEPRRRAAATKEGATKEGAASSSSSSSSSMSVEVQRAVTAAERRPRVPCDKLSARLLAEREAGTAHKHHLSMVVVGHVDAGKSTLMGHLLCKLGDVSRREMQRNKKESAQLNKGSFHYAWVLDAGEDERERGVTVDVATRDFETTHRRITLLDAPGHRDFIPSMITGAAQADVAMLVVAAASNEFEAGMSERGQTREHALLVYALGVRDLVVVVNKMDSVDYAKERYLEVCAALGEHLIRNVGFSPDRVRYIPVSGLAGDNLKVGGGGSSMGWWEGGPSLEEAIDAFAPRKREYDEGLLMIINDSFATSGKGDVTVVGRVERGTVQIGDTLVLMPSNVTCGVKKLALDGGAVDAVIAGDSAEIVLTSVEPTFVNVGCVLSSPLSIAPVIRRFRARVTTLPALTVPIIPGRQFTLHIHSISVSIHITVLVRIGTRGSGGKTAKGQPQPKPKRVRAVGRRKTAIIEIAMSGARAICADTFSECRSLGRFLLREKGVTVAAGAILRILE